MPHVLPAFLLALLTAGAASVPSSGATLTEKFSGNWRASWRERTFTRRPNLTEEVVERGNVAVRVDSRGTAGGFWREWKRENPRSGRFSWRWKVSQSLDNPHERSKKGDDYAARVKVIFETRFPAWRTRALCYVWAGREPVESLYRNPYSGSVGTIVVESGDALAGVWIREERDFVADYERYFGSKPGRVSGIAFMVDTDETKSEAVAWFDDLNLWVE